jgi:hypothetical protein
MHQQLWGYKVEEKLYVGVREQKRLNTTELDDCDRETFKLRYLLTYFTELKTFSPSFQGRQYQYVDYVDLFKLCLPRKTPTSS